MRFRTQRSTGLAIVLATVAICVVQVSSLAAATRLVSPAAPGPMIIDGDPADWERIPVAYFEDGVRVVAATHDDDAIYLTFRFGDERLARRLMARGVILWINGDGKTKNKDEAFGVRYTGSEDLQDYLETDEPDPAEDESDPRRDRMMRNLSHLRASPGDLTIITYGVKEIVPEGLPTGPTAASSVNEGIFCYEFRIPMAHIGGKLADVSPTRKRKVAVGIQIGGTTDAERESISSALQDSLGRRGAGGPSGGPPGSGGIGGISGGGLGGHGGGSGRRPPSGGQPPGGGTDRGDTKSRLNPKIEWLTIELTPAP